MRRTKTVFGAVAAALMMAAGPASAAEIVGSNLAASANTGTPSPGTQVPGSQLGSVTLPIAASAAGVIVEIKVKHDVVAPNANATGGFSIVTVTPPNFTARTDAKLPDFTWTNGEAAGIRTFVPTPDAQGRAQGVPIAAGERLALRNVSGTAPFVTNNFAGHDFVSFTNQVSGTVVYNDFPFELLAQMRIEPDADHDGYGDETQDRCLGFAGPTCAPPCENATQVGTAGNDIILGTAGNDVIAAGAGDDVVRGLGGDDIICGGDGNDKLKGGAGKDALYGEAGRDKLNGGGAKDRCFGGADKDAIGCEKAKQN